MESKSASHSVSSQCTCRGLSAHQKLSISSAEPQGKAAISRCRSHQSFGLRKQTAPRLIMNLTMVCLCVPWHSRMHEAPSVCLSLFVCLSVCLSVSVSRQAFVLACLQGQRTLEKPRRLSCCEISFSGINPHAPHQVKGCTLFQHSRLQQACGVVRADGHTSHRIRLPRKELPGLRRHHKPQDSAVAAEFTTLQGPNPDWPCSRDVSKDS